MYRAAKIEMYISEGKRVITFSGILTGMLAAWEGTPQWEEAFEISSRLKTPITPAYGYTGPTKK